MAVSQSARHTPEKMGLRIADADGAWEIEVPIDGPALESLRAQVARIRNDEGKYDSVVAKIGVRIMSSVADVLDPDLRPPTDAQISFAIAIARELNVNLPGEALIFRGAMGEFLDRYSQLFYSRRSRGASSRL